MKLLSPVNKGSNLASNSRFLIKSKYYCSIFIIGVGNVSWLNEPFLHCQGIDAKFGVLFTENNNLILRSPKIGTTVLSCFCHYNLGVYESFTQVNIIGSLHSIYQLIFRPVTVHNTTLQARAHIELAPFISKLIRVDFIII